LKRRRRRIRRRRRRRRKKRRRGGEGGCLAGRVEMISITVKIKKKVLKHV
jgi:hypothetical protein